MRDWEGFSPHSPEAYENYRQTLYGYERTPLNAVVESVDHEMDICRRERVTFDAVYANDRVVAYLHLPTSSQPPYQTVVWYPGSGAHQMSWDQYRKSYHDILKLLMRKGRAVVIPMYNNTYDRRIDTSSWDNYGLQTRNLVVQQAQDLARTIDYLETRADIDSSRLAYVGYVWGAIHGTRVLAYEERVKTGIFLYSAYCACTGQVHPSVDPARFAPFIKIPVLMINGKDAVGHTYEAAQRPMYNLLGTPEKDKKLILFPGGHTVPVDCRAQHDEAILDWLDKYLGPVTTIDP